jgi:hypothetical protein
VSIAGYVNLLLPLLLLAAAWCWCRRRVWAGPERAAQSWQAAVLLCRLFKQLEDQGYQVRGAGVHGVWGCKQAQGLRVWHVTLVVRQVQRAL